MRQIYTDDEMIVRVTAMEEIKDLMSRRAAYNANDWRRRELDELWVRSEDNRKTASYGGNWGYYVGMDNISAWYVVEHDALRKEQLRGVCSVNRNVQFSEENQGFGCMQFHPVSTPLVRLAGDGKTARGLWYSIGQETFRNADGSATAYWVNDKIGADFILEDDGWKIWHLVVCNDLYCEAGKAFADMPVYLEPEDDWVQRQFGTPTIRMTVHDPYFLMCDDYPAIPEPYQTFDVKNSFAPEGHPAYPQGFRAFKDGMYR